MIKISHLRKKYTRGKEVITDLNLQFGETGLNIVCGKSGCGKTTLINILGAMDLSFEGEVICDGLNLGKANYTQIADYRNFTSAFVFQKNSLFEFLTVEENLQLCMNIQNSDASISEALEKVGLKGFEKKKVKALSGGEKQRVAIARCLIKDCRIIFADEPTSALDSKNAHKIFQLFKELSKDRLVILVTHDVKKATMYADRLVRLIDGNIEEDITYNEVNTQPKELVQRKSKPFSMMPIFKHNLKTGLIINLFVILLMICAIVITNIALEGDKVTKEYELSSGEFNVDRAIELQIKNNIDMYKIVKANSCDSPYYYIKNAEECSYELSSSDYDFLMANFSRKYDFYEGSPDAQFQYLVIPGYSRNTIMSDTVGGMNVFWNAYEQSTAQYYVYNEDYHYDLVAGRLPEADNEILVTDTVADQYLRKRAFSPGAGFIAYYKDYVVNYDDLLNDTYELEYSDGFKVEKGEDYATLENKFIVWDCYGSLTSQIGGRLKTYYNHVEKEYKVVGIINTGLLDYYTYDYSAERYYLLSNFKTQTGSEQYMNSIYYQPSGYIVIPEHLGGTLQHQVNNKPYKILGVSANGCKANPYICCITGEYDFTGKGLAGYDDNIKIDRDHKIINKSTNNSSLGNDEVIISCSLANKLFPDIKINAYSGAEKYHEIANQIINFTFQTKKGEIEKELKIVGISKNLTSDIYISEDTFAEIYSYDVGSKAVLSVNLNGYNLNKRKKLMESLYKVGYALVPEDNMPGAYMEFVEGKGEMIETVDFNGLASLYPNYEIKEIEGKNYFFNGDINYGEVTGTLENNVMIWDLVYMKSSIVRNIALDESYVVESAGNLSPYYLYSEYYSSISDNECITSSDKGNSILEIVHNLYGFLFAVAVILSIGFICLKEFRQSNSVTKLSMLGVRNKDLISLNICTYVPIAIIIGVLSLCLTSLLVNGINNMYSYSFINFVKDSAGNEILYDEFGDPVFVYTFVNRIRLLFTSISYTTTLITTFATFAIMLTSSIIVTLKSRK